MRLLLSIFFLAFTTASFCQNEEIYKLAFSDTSNFRITTYLGDSRPAKVFIMDTTGRWGNLRFWIEGLNIKSAEEIKKMELSEHNAYNYAYLFKDSALERLIPDSEKKYLLEKSGKMKSKKISLKGDNYSAISSSKDLTGFYFVTTEPVFTSDMKYAFIDRVVFYKAEPEQELNDTYFGTTCIVYEKQKDNSWKKIHMKNHLIL